MNINEIAALKQLWSSAENLALALALSQSETAFQSCKLEIMVAAVLHQNKPETADIRQLLDKFVPNLEWRNLWDCSLDIAPKEEDLLNDLNNFWEVLSPFLPDKAAFAEAVLRFCGLGLPFVLQHQLSERINQTLLVECWRWEMLRQSDLCVYSDGKFIPKTNQQPRYKLDLYQLIWYCQGRIPKQIFELKELEELDLLGLNINGLPADISKLKQLKTLYIGCLEHFPTGCNLPKLQRLCVYGASNLPAPTVEKVNLELFANAYRVELHHMEEAWVNLYLAALPACAELQIQYSPLPEFNPSENARRSLQYLHLSDAIGKTLPAGLQNLPNLRTLWVESADIKRFPSFLGDYSRLEILRLHKLTRLQKLPASIAKLSQLRILSVSSSRLNELPDWLGRLQQLEQLILSNNMLEKLPEKLHKLPKLQHLELQGNNFKRFPSGINQLPQLAFCNFSDNFLTSSEGIFPLPPRLKQIKLSNSFSSQAQGLEFAQHCQRLPTEEQNKLIFSFK